MKRLNRKTGKARLDLNRREIVDLMVACTNAYQVSGAEKWANLHNDLKIALDEYDAELDIANNA